VSRKVPFVVLDGVEGCGKSSQLEWLAEAFDDKGFEVTTTFEPGGTTAGMAIREILLHRSDLNLAPMTEALLFSAARSQLIEEVIRPKSKCAGVLLCDRYAPSTWAYQGYAGGALTSKIGQLNKLVAGEFKPDLVIILDLDPAVGFARKTGNKDRIEQKDLAYHRKVRKGFLDFADKHKSYSAIVDADQTMAKVHHDIIRVVNERLGLKLIPVFEV